MRADRSTAPPGEPTPRTKFPAFDARLVLRAGGDRNPADRPGLAALVAALLDEGSRRRSGLELAAAVERLGAELTVRADWDRAEVRVRALSEDLSAVLDLVAEVALEPSFPPREVDRIRRQTLAEIDRRRDRPGRLADEAFAGLLYPGTVFGHPLGGDRSSVEAVTREEIEAFHRSWYDPGTACVSIVGRFDGDPAARLAASLGVSTGRPPEAVPETPASANERPGHGVRILLLDRPEAAQAELRLGHVGVARSHPDRTLLGVLNAVLGGKFTSRLNLSLRERHGITYGVHSRFVDRRSAGPFVVAAAVANESVGLAVGEILAELRRLQDEPIPETELAETRDYLTGVFPYTLQTSAGLAARIADLALHGLPDDDVERAQREIAESTPGPIQELARRHLRPEAATIVVEGPAATIGPQLGSFGEMETRPI